MKAEIYGIYNGVSESSFKDRNTGADIAFKTVTLLDVNGPDTLTCGVEKNVDLTILNRLDKAVFVCDLVNGRRPKISGIKMDSINKGGKVGWKH